MNGSQKSSATKGPLVDHTDHKMGLGVETKVWDTEYFKKLANEDGARVGQSHSYRGYDAGSVFFKSGHYWYTYVTHEQSASMWFQSKGYH